MAHRPHARAVTVAFVALFVAAGCGGQPTGPTPAAPGNGSPAARSPGSTTPGGGSPAPGDGVSGSIFVSGSSTVEPISLAVAEKFAANNPEFGYVVEGPGTGDGFALFCNGETDISDASRAIEEEEVQNCEANGVEFVELHIATDGIAVITSPENEQVQCLDKNGLYALLGPESEGFDSWADANELAAELGAAHAPYPDVPLTVTAPGEESGTYDSFVELVIAPIAEDRGLEPAARADYIASPNDNVIVDGIAGQPTSLGWVGYAFFAQNSERLKAIEVDGGDGCVAPTAETIADFSYPISRPLYIYVNAAKAAENPALAAYVDFYLSDEGIAAVEQVGYVPIPEEDLESTRSAWENR